MFFILSEDEEEVKEYDEEVASLTPTSLNEKLWIRALDKDKGRAFFLHGFDCALAGGDLSRRRGLSGAASVARAHEPISNAT